MQKFFSPIVVSSFYLIIHLFSVPLLLIYAFESFIDKGNMHFDTNFGFCFSLIFCIFPELQLPFGKLSFSYYSFIWYLGARNIKLSIKESYCTWVDIRCICSFQYCFLTQECLTQQLLKVSLVHNFLKILTGWKIKSLH